MASLPDYVAAAKPVPLDARQAWYKNTAQTYAGIMLWFVFWQDIVSGAGTFGGSLSAGLCVALTSLVVAALFCHFLTYLVPGMLGMKTGLPLYVVGTSTYGVRGGFIMPGFLMGALQFGWLAVNAFFSCLLICLCFKVGLDDAGDVIIPGPVHGTMTVVFILFAVFMGIMGIRYVAKVATFVPLIPLAILVILLVKTAGGISSFDASQLNATNHRAAHVVVAQAQTQAEYAPAANQEAADEGAADEEAAAEEAAPAKAATPKDLVAKRPLDFVGVFLFLATYVVGFFATAGAAGADFGMNNRNASDVHWGGLVGIVGATVFAGGVGMLVVAGAYGTEGMISPENLTQLNPVKLMPDIMKGEAVMGLKPADWMLFLLAASSLAPACFPAFIAANSFRTTMPNISPWITVGSGALVAIALAVSGWAGEAVAVFAVVGASFGPICGAMMADYLLAGRQWAGPRAGFNLAGWISWAVGFYIGAVDLVVDKLVDRVPELSVLELNVPCPPMAALIVGFVLYLVLAKAGLQSRSLEMPAE